MRSATVREARATLPGGSSDSAAAIEAISDPVSEKITIGTAPRTAAKPFGRRPPELKSVASGDVPRAAANPRWPAAIAMKAMIAATFISENQYSNSP